MIPIIIPMQTATNCVATQTDVRGTGIAVILIVLWMIVIGITFSKALDRNNNWWLLIPLAIFLAPFILMVIVG